MLVNSVVVVLVLLVVYKGSGYSSIYVLIPADNTFYKTLRVILEIMQHQCMYVPILQMIMEMSNISSTHLRQEQVSTGGLYESYENYR